jgi:N-acetylglucosamine kinase-like BadF-type ATPase
VKHISVYLSVDGGGTKLAFVLFDDGMRVFSRAGAASVNTNFEAEDAVERHMRDGISRCLAPWLANHPDEPPLAAYVSIVGPMMLFKRVLQEFAPNCWLLPIGEGMMHCLSGSLSQSGIVALSGTGSGVALCMEGDVHTHLGGWGSLVGDEGSGYAIGRDGIAAAIRAIDGWGGPSLLNALLIEHYQLKKLNDIVPLIYRAHNPRSVVGSASPIVGMAASQGDAVALGIYQKAACAMASQVDGLIRKTGISPYRHAVTACGGAWKGCAHFFKAFQKDLKRIYPDIRANLARYEVEAGGAVFHLIKENPDRTPQEIDMLLSLGFKRYAGG